MKMTIQELQDKTEFLRHVKVDTEEAMDILEDILRGEPYTDEVCELIHFYSSKLLNEINDNHMFKLQEFANHDIVEINEEEVN
ncbi:hypothetical protein [Staphylococcus phage KSAP7]|nr:hypothetical protein [Staphylococcus phage KSAP7]BBM81493.1 hypothetical protein [Staphylococcus phage KSAP11]